MSFAPASGLLAEVSDGPAGAPRISGRFEGDRILVPLLSPEVPAVTDQLRVAASLARTADASLHAVDPVATPDRAPREYGSPPTTDDERELVDWAVENASSSASAGGGFLHARRLVNDILATIERNDVDTLVVPSESGTGLLRPELSERLALRADCDVVTVNGRSGYEGVPSILLAVSGGPHSGLAVDVAQRIAVDCDAWIDVLHVVDESPTTNQQRRAEAYVEAAAGRIDRPESTATWVLEAADAAEAIIEQSGYYDLTVVGAPTKGRLRRFIAGSTNRTIRDNARSVVLSARKDD